ncbi:MAG TPA: Mur ligase domain-containing protein, partial [Cyclobacteriaceae bacterium]|nr:Mur ligase domain-containing protein [Cyclobacteriaceae bacterium]
MLLFSQLKNITHGTVLQLAADRPVHDLILDSRKAIVREGSVFFAVKGRHGNGHAYIDTLYKNGIRQFVVEEDVPVDAYPEANFIRVASSVQALQKIVARHRSNFSIPVIGVTGSNGKTIVKEWLYQLLSKHYT